MGLISGIKKIPRFFKEVKAELKKVSWSTKEELVSATILVIVASFILTLYIALVDTGLSRAIQMFLK